MAHNQMPCTQLHTALASLPRYHLVLSDLMTPRLHFCGNTHLISLFQHVCPTSLAIVIFLKNEVNMEMLFCCIYDCILSNRNVV